MDKMRLKPLGANQTELTLADGALIFFSYQTAVAAFVPGTGYVRTEQFHSRTTAKHIGQWLRRHGAHGHYTVRPQSYFDQLAGGGKC